MLYSVLRVSVDVLNVDLSSLSDVIVGDLPVSDIQVTTVLVSFEQLLCQLKLLLRSLANNSLIIRCQQCVT